MSYHIIYHAGCTDGFGAAYMIDRVIRRWPGMTPNIHWHPMNHGDSPPHIPEGSHLIMVDFANVSVAWLDTMRDWCDSVLVLDHHQTAEHVFEQMSGLYACSRHGTMKNMLAPYAFVLDQSRSGVGLAAVYALGNGLNPTEILPFWPYLEDRDLWLFNFDMTRDLFAAVSSYPFTIEAWHDMAQREVLHLAQEGAAINRYRDMLIDDAVSKAFVITLDGLEIPCTASPYSIGSDVAGLLAETDPGGIGAYCIHHGDDVQLGLRSRGDGPDVAEIAERHGGGGHKHASGLRLPSLTFHHVAAP